MRKPQVKVAFASGPRELNHAFLERMLALYPELPLLVVSEFPPHAGEWMPYHVNRSFLDNLRQFRAELKGTRIRLAATLLAPRSPYPQMHVMALLLAPRGFLAFNENLDSFMLRPRSATAITRHLWWRVKSALRFELRPGGNLYTFLWRIRHPREARIPWAWWAARLTAWLRVRRPARDSLSQGPEPPTGISVVIPSRDGQQLLALMLPGLMRELGAWPSEVIVVDNGSSDNTAEFLASRYRDVRLEQHPEPLSFARSVNRGIRLARYSHVCLLNNDMLLESGFFAPLLDAFGAVPDLFCATPQILFPAGVRREETGKAVMAKTAPEDFPIRCQEPVPGENLSYVLYGSGGCSLYAAQKLRRLGGMKELYEPAYVEDLDLGYRAWQRGWPTVFVSAARVLHRHRATTSKYYSSQQLQAMVEVNYLRFLASTVSSQRLFRELWSQAIWRLFARGIHGDAAAAQALLAAPQLPLLLSGGGSSFPEERILALGNGQHAVFPAHRPRNKPVVLILSPYLPFPLAHGGAVRMYNLMRRAAADFDQVLLSFCDRLETPPRELGDVCVEVILVEREGTHALPSSRYPDAVEEFRSETFRGVLEQTMRKWRPQIAQLEFTQMAQYAADCAPAKTLLVEHDITCDLYEQLLRLNEEWETRRQYLRWRHFEPEAWRGVDRVITMSEPDRRQVSGARAMVLPNGVDLDRFRPARQEPEPRRLLFIGALRHLPNLLALEYFLNQVWPHLDRATLHIIAGPRPEYFLERYRSRVEVNQPGIELEGFVEDVRPAYTRAAVVVAPLLASAGTNIKILEALAMGKAIVSTPQGINGLDLQPGEDLLVTEKPVDMAHAIDDLLNSPEMRRGLESQARRRAEQDYGWDLIARRQRELYRELGCTPHLQATSGPSSFDSQSSFAAAGSGRDSSVATHSG